MITESDVLRLAQSHFSKNTISWIEDLGNWVRHNFRVHFTDRKAVVYKFNTNKDWLDNSVHEFRVTEILEKNGLPVSPVLVVDDSQLEIEYSYMAVEQGPGERLDRLIRLKPDDEIKVMYRAVGQFYRKLHSIKGKESGVWANDPEELFPVSPTDYLFENEIKGGSGAALVEKGTLSRLHHQRIVDIWTANLNYLKDHQPVMVHGSPFPWTIYLDKPENDWKVTHITGLGDSFWWDASYDLTFLIDAPFTFMFDQWRIAFLQGYGVKPEVRRLILYRLLQILCAVNNVYMQPKSEQSETWKQSAINAIPGLLKSLETTLK
jgi:hypothetical protein